MPWLGAWSAVFGNTQSENRGAGCLVPEQDARVVLRPAVVFRNKARLLPVTAFCCPCSGLICPPAFVTAFGSIGKKSGHWLLQFRDSCGIPFRTGFLLEMIPRKPLKLTEGVLENRALHQSESSISVRWVAENLCDPSLNHGMVDGTWRFGYAPAPLTGELRMTRLVPPPGAQRGAPEPSAHTHPVRKQ